MIAVRKFLPRKRKVLFFFNFDGLIMYMMSHDHVHRDCNKDNVLL